MYFFRNRWVQLVMITILTSLPYLNIFANGFVIDDHVFIGTYHPSVVEAFRGAVPSGHEGVYRPVRGILYTLYYNLFGTNPFFYHLHSLLVHLMATVLVFLIIDHLSTLGHLGNLGNLKNIGLIGGLLFGLHPVHTESITYIAASMEMTGVVFMLAAFLLYIGNWKLKIGNCRSASLLFALLAFFTYEMTLTLPLLLVLYEGTLGSLGRLGGLGGLGRYKRVLPYFVGAGVYLFVRFGMLGVGSRGPYLANSVYLTAITMPRVVIQYLFLLIWPAGLANNHIIAPGIEAFVYRGYRTAAIMAQSILDPEILASIGLIGLMGLMGWKIRKTYPLVSFGIGWFFVSLLPGLEIIPQGSMMNEKLLYIPSVGPVLVMSFLFTLLRAPRSLRVLIVGLLVVLYGTRTFTRNLDWHDDVTLWQKDVTMYPTESAYARFALGNAYNNLKDYQKAIEQYQKSVEINPGFAVGYASLSRTYRDLGNTELSNINYQMAQNAEPGFWGKP